jgi:broad specificity phosphatase PhoE
VRLFLVRHAESEGNHEGRLQGRHEFALTTRGEAQATALANRFAGVGLSAVYSSPIGRTLATAEALASVAGVGVKVEDLVQEYDFGELSGMTWREIWETRPEIVEALVSGRSEFPEYPGEEGREPFRDRVRQGLAAIIETHEKDSDVAVVTHAGPIAVYLLDVLGRDYSRPVPFTIDNASVTMVEVNPEAPPGFPQAVLMGLNDTCHLVPDGEARAA